MLSLWVRSETQIQLQVQLQVQVQVQVPSTETRRSAPFWYVSLAPSSCGAGLNEGSSGGAGEDGSLDASSREELLVRLGMRGRACFMCCYGTQSGATNKVTYKTEHSQRNTHQETYKKGKCINEDAYCKIRK